MPDKEYGVDFTNDTSPTGTYTISANNGTVTVDISLSDLHKALTYAASSDINTGTDTVLPVNSDALAGSNTGTRVIAFTHTLTDTQVITGDGKSGIPIPAELNGMNIVGVTAFVHTQGVTGTTDVQIRRRRSGSDVDVLSTKVTVAAEYYASDGVINASNDDLATGDMLFIDVDAVHTTAPYGLSITVTTRLP